MGLLSSGLSTWSMVGQSSLARAAEAASPFCLESKGKVLGGEIEERIALTHHHRKEYVFFHKHAFKYECNTFSITGCYFEVW